MYDFKLQLYVGGPPSRRSHFLFSRETKQRAWTRDLRRDWKRGGGEKRGLGEARGVVGKGTQRGVVGKGTQRGVVEKGRREAVENGAEGTSQRCWHS